MSWHIEYLAEMHRQEILEEAEQIRMENNAISIHPYHPTLFTRTMFNLANWMISTGKELRKRYEIPRVTQNKTNGFAH